MTAKQAQICVPAQPEIGDVVKWWTLQPHPIHFYVMGHRAEYYRHATCAQVLGSSHAHGKDFVDEWLVTSWHEPSGDASSGGRMTTAALHDWLSDVDVDKHSGVRVRTTFDEVRALLVEHLVAQAAARRQEAEDCDRRAAAARQWADPPSRRNRG